MKKCFLCGSEYSILDFNYESFQNCYLKILFRSHKLFKYGDIHLDSIDTIGYHSNCYKKVTVLKKKFNDEFTNFCKQRDVPTLAIKLEPDNMSSDSSQHYMEPSWSTADTHFKSEIPYGVSPDEAVLNSLSLKTELTTPTDPLITSGGVSSCLEPDFDASSSQSSLLQQSSTTTIEEVLCLFCNCTWRKTGQRRVNVISPKCEATVTKLKEIASTLNDSQILDKLENQIVAYHPTCYSSYLVRMKRHTKEQAYSDWHKDREIHKLAFNSLATFIKQEVIENRQVIYLTQLNSRYKGLLREIADGKNQPLDFSHCRSEHLERRITKVFGDLVTIETSTGPHYKKIVYVNDEDESKLAKEVVELEAKEDSRFKDVANSLRHCVQSMSNQKLPGCLTEDDVINGECGIPEQLYEFMCDLIGGPGISHDDSNQVNVKIKSLCSDMIYMIRKGQVKPGKNTNLGLTLKSLTNSRQVLTIGYNLGEELENEMTYTSVEKTKVIPSSINAVPGRSTHVARKRRRFN